MKKIYLLLFSLVSTLSFSQQVLKRVTDTPTELIVEMFAVRNGSSLPNTVGSSNFDSGTSDSKGNVIVYNPSLGNTYTKMQLPSGTSTHTDEQIGNGIFVFNSYALLNNQNFVANGGSGATLSLIIPEENGDADSIEDSNNITDLLYTKFYLPKTLTDGNPIPTGLIAKCLSRLGKDYNTGGTAISSNQVIFSFNGTTWLPIATDWLGYTPIPLQEIGTNGQLLGINQFADNSSITIYPNPTNDIVNVSTTETIEQINVYDMFGRLLKSQNGNNENEIISIEELPNAMYLIEVKAQKGSRTTKIIKE